MQRRERPAKRVAVGVLFRDESGRILLVHPTYTDGWLLPGGHLEAGEAPHVAAVREVEEELGLERSMGRMLCIDSIPDRDGQGDSLVVVLEGGTLDKDDLARIRLPINELDDYRLVDPTELSSILPPGRARQVEACLRADHNGSTPALADGYLAS